MFKNITAVLLASACLFAAGCSFSKPGVNFDESSYSVPLAADAAPKFSRIKLDVKGTIIARDGANLCKEPSMFSEQIAVLEDHTEVQVISAADAFQSEIREDGTWLYVSANGKKGYVYARYVDISLTAQASEYTNAQWFVLGAILYQQYMTDSSHIRKPRALDIDFDREQVGREQEDGSFKYYYHLYKPENLTMDQLSEAYYNEYAKKYYDGTFEDYYVTEYQKVYGWQGADNGMWTERLAVESLDSVTDTEIFYTTREYYSQVMQSELPIYEEHVFSLVFEDGRWKCGQLGDISEPVTTE